MVTVAGKNLTPSVWVFSHSKSIALVSRASKILLRIILERIRVKTETEIADEQAGFRQGRATRHQTTDLRILMHKAREHQQPLYMCFVDFKKVEESIRMTKDRDKWRKYVHGVAKPRIEEGPLK